MVKLVPLKCTVCGANLPRDTLICEHCGTHFVLSEDKASVAVQAREENEIERAIEQFKEEYVEGETFEKPGIPRDYGPYDFRLDDRVDRKILKYLNETKKSKYAAIMEKYKEYQEEKHKLRRLLKSNQMDEDSYADRANESWRKYEIAKEQINRMVDCGEGLKIVESFIMNGVKNKTDNFKDIKSIKEILFNSVDGSVLGNTFIYKITGYADCYLKSGMFSKKYGRKYFSAEVDYRTGEVTQYDWEPNESLNVQEYRARPLPLPKFTLPEPQTSS